MRAMFVAFVFLHCKDEINFFILQNIFSIYFLSPVINTPEIPVKSMLSEKIKIF